MCFTLMFSFKCSCEAHSILEAHVESTSFIYTFPLGYLFNVSACWEFQHHFLIVVLKWPTISSPFLKKYFLGATLLTPDRDISL